MSQRVYYVTGFGISAMELPAFPKPLMISSSESRVRHLINWILSALAVWVVAQFVTGFHVRGAGAALVAALVIGFVNATLGTLLKLVTLPLTILTLGIFWLVINALMLELASLLLRPAFRVDSFGDAFLGAIALSLVNMLFRWLAGTSRKTV